MKHVVTVLTLAIVLCLPGISLAEGLIYQLPDDGAWAKFEIEGEGVNSDGTVSITITGTQTLRSVGSKMVDNQPCRWIELESDVTFERVGRNEAQSLKEIIKLLVPESQLTKGKDPREKVIKAYKGTSAETMRELDLTGDGKREIQSLDEILHGPLKKTAKLPAAEINVKGKNWKCEGFEGEEKTEDVVFITETQIHEQAPFGVVTYKYEKARQRNNESQGGRNMKWKLVNFGKDAKSAAPRAE
jgi:hypothetical protein